ncbi:MAG TPA: pilus assembly protein TadG-related protein [Gaiellaceae bacterium]
MTPKSSTPHIAPKTVSAAPREGERGQALVMVVLFLFVLLGMAAMVIDVGYAYYAHRSLQAQADAAALAGAQELPDPTRAQAVAYEYSGEPGAKNARENVRDVTVEVRTKCLTKIPGCDPVNAVTVTERAEVNTLFAGVLGIDKFNISVKSTACSPCGTKPLDLMLVLDRTGSMCQDHWGNNDPNCTDLKNAQEGMRTFLTMFSSNLQWVGLAALPPATSRSRRCNTPDTPAYDSKSSPYVLVPLSQDYTRADGNLNQNSDLVKTIDCQKGGGRTAYANALEAAQAELDLHGRPDVKDIIIFLSDGAANVGPTYYPTTSPYRRRPCAQGVASAAVIKNRGTIIYSIGYDLDALNGGANECQSYTGADESPAITAYSALQQIASAPGTFYDKPSPGQLRTIFTDIAADIAKGTSALIDNDIS